MSSSSSSITTTTTNNNNKGKPCANLAEGGDTL